MKKGLTIAVLFCLAVWMIGCTSSAEKAIATVNGEKITQADLDQYYAMQKLSYEQQQGVKLDEKKDRSLISSLKEASYNNLIMKTLLWQQADKQGIKVSDKTIDSKMTALKNAENKNSKDGYQKFLRDNQLTEKSLREELKTEEIYSILRSRKTANVRVSDDEVRKYYDQNPTQFQDPGGIQIYHILVPTEKQADSILAQLKKGADFSALAAKYSTDTASKDKGGDVGLVNENTQFVTEFKQAALALRPGELYPEPVKSQYGYHIIKAGEKKAPSALPYDQVKDQLKAKLLEEKQDQAFNQYLNQLKQHAQIKDLRKK